ncbi:hypothetical protein [Glycomyces salinus]|uniref:hypothetical protein n=1 Tax=Glycomyces salinus TaxID=980294 RepID=UPI0018EB85E1|nr:hypothetical protein [Glycomyces salinus]
MAEADMIDSYMCEFRRGPAVFVVFRFDPDSYRVDCDDGNGPSQVCRIPADATEAIRWHGPWNGDRWCSWIAAEARKVIANPD